MFLSVVIPAFNEQENIPFIIKRVGVAIEQVELITKYEIIICDDHSTDQTYNTVRQLGISNIRAIRLSRRSGSHTAIRAGLSKAKGDAVLCISADGQDDPMVLGEMLEKVRQGKQIIWGVRNARKKSYVNNKLSMMFYRLLNFIIPNDNNIDLANADFYLLNRKVVDALNSCGERNTSLFGLIAWIGFKQDFVLYERRERVLGKSKWDFKSKLKLAVDWIIAFSGLPLKIISVLGITFATLGFLYALLIIMLSFLGKTVPGWAETVVLMLLIGGIQMIMLGILGEYLWRSLEEGRERPLFFVEEEDNFESL